jgi:hypothetical protein
METILAHAVEEKGKANLFYNGLRPFVRIANH